VTSGDATLLAHHRYAGTPADARDHAAYAAWVASAIARGVYLGRLALADGAVVAGAGAVLLEWGPVRGDPGAVRARLVNVYTEPAWRRRGARSSPSSTPTCSTSPRICCGCAASCSSTAWTWCKAFAARWAAHAARAIG